MYFTMQDWIQFLVSQRVNLGPALMLNGVLFMYFGRRFAVLLVTVNMVALAGGLAWIVGDGLVMDAPVRWGIVLLSAWLAGRFAWRSYRAFAAFVGSLAASLAGAFYLAMLDCDATTIALAQAIIFAGTLAVASVYVDEIIMFLTALEGGFLFLSGALISAASRAVFFEQTWQLLTQERLVLAFAIVALTVTGYFLQKVERMREPHYGMMHS